MGPVKSESRTGLMPVESSYSMDTVSATGSVSPNSSSLRSTASSPKLPSISSRTQLTPLIPAAYTPATAPTLHPQVLKEAPVSSPLPMRRQAPPPPQEPKKSDAFVRKSIKYLIPHQTLHQLKDGLRGFLQVSPFKLASGEVLTTQENHSSYFDNSQLYMYHSRVLKEEGAKLIRIRWYGSSLKKSAIFVERKVHHEDISGKDSNKKRFEIQHKDMEKYLDGKFCPKDIPLAAKIQSTILEHRLQPTIHTLYKRTSYINKDDDSVRITLDEDVRVHREAGMWSDLVRTDGKPVGKGVTMPFSIIEVKLKCAGEETSLPQWLEALLTGVHADKVKISKYNYGCAMLLPQLCRAVPNWIGHVQSPFEGVDFTAVPVANTATNNFTIEVEKKSEGSDVVTLELCDSHNSLDTRRPSSIRRALSRMNPFLKERWTNPNTTPGTISKSPSTIHFVPPTPSKPPANPTPELKKPAKSNTWDPKAFLANERTFYHWIRFALSLAIFSIGLSDWNSPGLNTKLIAVLCATDIMIIYATTMFHLRRVGLLERVSDPTFVHRAFNDYIGNTLLALIVFGFITVYIILLLVQGPSFHNGDWAETATSQP